MHPFNGGLLGTPIIVEKAAEGLLFFRCFLGANGTATVNSFKE